MNLMQKILSSRPESRTVAVQPYQAVTGIPSFGFRFIAPELVNTPVSDAIMITAPVAKVPRDLQAVVATPPPVTLRNGTAPTSGNNAPNRRG